MKYRFGAVFLFVLATTCSAISVEEIGRLSELKTSDDLLLQMIQKDGLDNLLTTADVIYLREHGASERVIQYCIRLSDSKKAALVPSEQQDSEKIAENLRAYTTTTKKGKKVRVITNLDENGQRMGPPAPPAPPEQQSAPPVPPPQEIRVTVTQEQGPYREEEEYPVEYADPYAVYDAGYYPYAPYYPYIPPMYGNPRPPHNPPVWRERVPQMRVHQRPTQPHRPAPNTASRGTLRR